MAYGKIKLDTITWDDSGTDTDITVSTIPTAAQLAAKADLASPTFTGTAVFNDLTVNGTNTVINTTTLQVEDKNLELGKVSTPTDTTADGGGITLKGATDKEIKWVDSTDAWTFNQNISTTGNITVSNTQPKIFLTDTNNTSDYSIQNENGNLNLYDETNSASRLRITAAGDATFSGSVSDSKGDLRAIVRSVKTSAYTLVASDAGKCIYINTGGVTINANVFGTDGHAVTIVNDSGSDQTITQGSGMNLYNSADGSQGNRTLAGRGMATIWFASSTSGYISGAGLS